MSKKMGRPTKYEAKRKRIEFRVTEEELDRINYLVNKRGESKTEIFERAIKMLENLERATE